ncbi:ribonuclease D [Nocardioides albertanoniae]|uniref:Ribonuclease D n=1 Tax=Nocardioides albertanoniae TaxID=1175486 RepID=A0A543A3K8_9ACTN|nr:ribonuclease D [Nocardioides albertanoniae]TQL67175.1 ribonuclease D [Nocardioides albertanoniae]
MNNENPDPKTDPKAEAAIAPETEEEVAPAPLLTLRDGLPAVIDTDDGLAKAAEALARGTGPVGIDAERASGYRYSNRAYLLQLRRVGSGSWLIDPIGLTTMQPLIDALDGTEWILHAATQDLPCLSELGLHPTALFDTELAGRLLGYPRVGLGTLVETVLGFTMLKEHSAADWSTRPLPDAWLEYAALDVEVLVELREALAAELVEQGKDEWARQEFNWLRGFEAPVRVDAWRRTSGMHRVRGRRGLAAVRGLWTERDRIAQQRDVTPSRIIPDAAIVAASQELPQDKASLLGLKGFHGRGAERYVTSWLKALDDAVTMGEDELPVRSPRSDGPPPPRAWSDKDPVAARRLALARESVNALAEERNLPAENLLTPDFLRRTMWAPPKTREPGALLDDIIERLAGLGARGWQIALTAPLLTDAILHAEPDDDSSDS